MAAPTRFPSGVTNSRPTAPLGNYGLPNPVSYHEFHNDFDFYTSGSWTNTTTGTGTVALTAGDGGLLAIVTSATSADNVFLQKTTECFLMETGKPAWFAARFKVSAATTSSVAIGLQVTDTTPLDVTDGIYFLVSTGSANVSIICRKNASTGSTSATVGTLVSDTFTELAWYWDGKDTVAYFQDGVQKGSLTGVASAYLPDTTLTPSMGIQTGSAAAKTLTVDYLFASKAR
ncbi:hypothetical protein [Sphingobium sp.]|uniref:hypothetical protein n=1 Tax=Sphingobium sp. TaxID=1912891 RepID=UPI000C4F597D|nr:hypothetical protein [Sphingobium sp.]MBS87148.1 hypothetical protein [Sphingobium sp.]